MLSLNWQAKIFLKAMGNKASEAYTKHVQALEMLLKGKKGYNYISE